MRNPAATVSQAARVNRGTSRPARRWNVAPNQSAHGAGGQLPASYETTRRTTKTMTW